MGSWSAKEALSGRRAHLLDRTDFDAPKAARRDLGSEAECLIEVTSFIERLLLVADHAEVSHCSSVISRWGKESIFEAANGLNPDAF